MSPRINVAGVAQGYPAPAEMSWIDPQALLRLAEVAGWGKSKYGDPYYYRNNDLNWTSAYNSLQRHLLAWLGGESWDPESGLPHLAHAAWRVLQLLSAQERAEGLDDRPPR